jgi:hypothetical protein
MVLNATFNNISVMSWHNITNSAWQFRQNGSFWTGRSLQTYYMDLSFALVQFSFLERLTQYVCIPVKTNLLP